MKLLLNQKDIKELEPLLPLKEIKRILNLMGARTGNQSDMAKLRRPVNKPTIMDKSLGTLLHFWAFCNSHRTNPFPHPTNNVGRVYQEFFSEFQHCMYPYWGGGGGVRTARKFRKGCIVL